jgi:hypothetical protein
MHWGLAPPPVLGPLSHRLLGSASCLTHLELRDLVGDEQVLVDHHWVKVGDGVQQVHVRHVPRQRW